MREESTREIGGMTFQVQQLPATKAVLLSRRLASIVGPAALKGLGGAAGGLANLDVGGLSTAAEMLFEKLTEAEFSSIMKQLLDGCFVEHDGKKALLLPQFDHLMRGKILEIYQLLAFALEVNFGPLGDSLRALLAQAQAAQPKASSSPNAMTSPGPAGD